MVDGRISVLAYTKLLIDEVDGKAWVLTIFAFLIALLDLLAETNVLPIRDREDFGKALVLLIFSPLITFLVVTMLRQLPFSSKSYAKWMRAIACIGVFLILNF